MKNKECGGMKFPQAKLGLSSSNSMNDEVKYLKRIVTLMPKCQEVKWLLE